MSFWGTPEANLRPKAQREGGALGAHPPATGSGGAL